MGSTAPVDVGDDIAEAFDVRRFADVLPLSAASSPSAFVARPATRSDSAVTDGDWTLGGADLRDPGNWRLALCEVDSR